MTKKWFGPILILAALVATALVFPRLPAQVPTHWNFAGEVDDTTPRFPGAFMAPLIAAAFWILLPVLRAVDPRKRNYERFDDTFWLLLNLLTLFMLLIQAATIAFSLGYQFDMSRIILGGVGVMFVGLGNYLPRLRSNWWMGIRTPWTLENEEVWRRTHRLGGRTFVAGGLLCVLCVLLLPNRVAYGVAFGMLMAGSLVPVVYSYVIWRQLRRGS